SNELKVREFYRLHNACVKLKESIKLIYENPLVTDQNVLNLGTAENTIDYTILNTPTLNVAKTLLGNRYSLDLIDLFQSHDFKDSNTDVDMFIKYPVVYDENLENLAFMHKSFPNMNAHLNDAQKTQLSNERLEFLGDSWLGALVSYIVYTRFPSANEGMLSQMKESIVNNNNLFDWSTKLNFTKRLQGNIATPTRVVKDKMSKRYADCVEAYIGALVIDRFGTEFLDIKEWLEELSEKKLAKSSQMVIKEPLNKNAKNELAELLQINKLGHKLHYRKLTEMPPFRVEVKIGDILLDEAEGNSIREAEHRAAMKVLENDELLRKYSVYDLEDGNSKKYSIEE
nr:Chain A, K. polysporus Dcr1 [Vanderwaltozyma polyspora DSM 70294]3RV0_B Chain B, K. polysporus Dcr1 [Vanderwaltozyma polyspora DSM 70294]3RV0_C Chain C, K. polysporus Dcr1 [Vanderwaltozyma polyspora DSM 70294]3RV0_D Chain D, K. polysporus Dcr1 [Vanderwaltozyma polyspora DSM 70294]